MYLCINLFPWRWSAGKGDWTLLSSVNRGLVFVTKPSRKQNLFFQNKFIMYYWQLQTFWNSSRRMTRICHFLFLPMDFSVAYFVYCILRFSRRERRLFSGCRIDSGAEAVRTSSSGSHTRWWWDLFIQPPQGSLSSSNTRLMPALWDWEDWGAPKWRILVQSIYVV